MKKNANIVLLCFFLFFMSTVVYSHKGKDLPRPAGPPPPVGLPIDGGVFYLLISGVAYGVYTLRKKCK